MNGSSASGSGNSALVNFGLLVVRVACALPMLYHGSAILFGAFGGPGPVKMAAVMQAPTIVGYLVGMAQFCGGLAVLTGLFFRVGALCVVIAMTGAVALVHLSHGYNLEHTGMEYALTVLLLGVALLFTGSGTYSLGGMLPGPLKKL